MKTILATYFECPVCKKKKLDIPLRKNDLGHFECGLCENTFEENDGSLKQSE